MTSPDVPFDPGPPHQVSKSPRGDHWTLTFTQVFHHPVESVWSALTDPAELPEWAPYTANRDLSGTGPATLIMVDNGERTELDGEVLRVDRNAVLEHRWGDELLCWELTPTDGGTQLTLQQSIDSTDQLPMVAAGWHLCLLVADRYLAGEPIGPIVGPAAKKFGWDDLCGAYGALLGVD